MHDLRKDAFGLRRMRCAGLSNHSIMACRESCRPDLLASSCESLAQQTALRKCPGDEIKAELMPPIAIRLAEFQFLGNVAECRIEFTDQIVGRAIACASDLDPDLGFQVIADRRVGDLADLVRELLDLHQLEVCRVTVPDVLLIDRVERRLFERKGDFDQAGLVRVRHRGLSGALPGIR